MIRYLGFLLASFGNIVTVYAQTVSQPNEHSVLDTVETYSVSLSATYSSETARYFVDGKEVEKRIYDRYRIPVEKSLKCHPCILKSYNVDNELISISTQYAPDCFGGSFTAFYPGGTVKVRGQYRQNTSGNWSNLYNRGYCSVAEGKWYYYSLNGSLLKIETYDNGKLINTE